MSNARRAVGFVAPFLVGPLAVASFVASFHVAVGSVACPEGDMTCAASGHGNEELGNSLLMRSKVQIKMQTATLEEGAGHPPSLLRESEEVELEEGLDGGVEADDFCPDASSSVLNVWPNVGSVMGMQRLTISGCNLYPPGTKVGASMQTPIKITMGPNAEVTCTLDGFHSNNSQVTCMTPPALGDPTIQPLIGHDLELKVEKLQDDDTYAVLPVNENGRRRRWNDKKFKYGWYKDGQGIKGGTPELLQVTPFLAAPGEEVLLTAKTCTLEVWKEHVELRAVNLSLSAALGQGMGRDSPEDVTADSEDADAEGDPGQAFVCEPVPLGPQQFATAGAMATYYNILVDGSKYYLSGDNRVTAHNGWMCDSVDWAQMKAAGESAVIARNVEPLPDYGQSTYWPGVPKSDFWAAEWAGTLLISEAGSYTFKMLCDDNCWFFLDGAEKMRRFCNSGWVEVTLDLEAGEHAIKLQLVELGGWAKLHFKYQGPDTDFGLWTVPASVLVPDTIAAPPDSNHSFPRMSEMVGGGFHDWYCPGSESNVWWPLMMVAWKCRIPEDIPAGTFWDLYFKDRGMGASMIAPEAKIPEGMGLASAVLKIVPKVSGVWKTSEHGLHIEGLGLDAPAIAADSITLSGQPCTVQNSSQDHIDCHLGASVIPEVNSIGYFPGSRGLKKESFTVKDCKFEKINNMWHLVNGDTEMAVHDNTNFIDFLGQAEMETTRTSKLVTGNPAGACAYAERITGLWRPKYDGTYRFSIKFSGKIKGRLYLNGEQLDTHYNQHKTTQWIEFGNGTEGVPFRVEKVYIPIHSWGANDWEFFNIESNEIHHEGAAKMLLPHETQKVCMTYNKYPLIFEVQVPTAGGKMTYSGKSHAVEAGEGIVASVKAAVNGLLGSECTFDGATPAHKFDFELSGNDNTFTEGAEIDATSGGCGTGALKVMASKMKWEFLAVPPMKIGENGWMSMCYRLPANAVVNMFVRLQKGNDWDFFSVPLTYSPELLGEIPAYHNWGSQSKRGAMWLVENDDQWHCTEMDLGSTLAQHLYEHNLKGINYNDPSSLAQIADWEITGVAFHQPNINWWNWESWGFPEMVGTFWIDELAFSPASRTVTMQGSSAAGVPLPIAAFEVGSVSAGAGLVAEWFFLPGHGCDFGKAVADAEGMEPFLKRIDSEISPTTYPNGGSWSGFAHNDNIYGRWNGRIKITTAGTYKFKCYADDSCRIFLEGKPAVPAPAAGAEGKICDQMVESGEVEISGSRRRDSDCSCRRRNYNNELPDKWRCVHNDIMNEEQMAATGAASNFSVVGYGRCWTGEYTGWWHNLDLTDCLKACAEEDQCLFVSWKPDQHCVRYDWRAFNRDQCTPPKYDHEHFITFSKGWHITDTVGASDRGGNPLIQPLTWLGYCGGYRSSVEGSIDLEPGDHGLFVDMLEAGGWGGVEVQYSGPDTGDEWKNPTSEVLMYGSPQDGFEQVPVMIHARTISDISTLQNHFKDTPFAGEGAFSVVDMTAETTFPDKAFVTVADTSVDLGETEAAETLGNLLEGTVTLSHKVWPTKLCMEVTFNANGDQPEVSVASDLLGSVEHQELVAGVGVFPNANDFFFRQHHHEPQLRLMPDWREYVCEGATGCTPQQEQVLETCEMWCANSQASWSVKCNLPSGKCSNCTECALLGNLITIPYAKMTASQSSTGWGGDAHKALTASPSTSYGGGTCTHTHANYQEWWKVSLEGTWQIAEVKLTNRGDCCGFRMTDLSIYVDDTVCATGVTLGQGETLDVECVGMGSEIKVQQPGNQYLTICGFEAKGAEMSSAALLQAGAAGHKQLGAGVGSSLPMQAVHRSGRAHAAAAQRARRGAHPRPHESLAVGRRNPHSHRIHRGKQTELTMKDLDGLRKRVFGQAGLHMGEGTVKHVLKLLQEAGGGHKAGTRRVSPLPEVDPRDASVQKLPWNEKASWGGENPPTSADVDLMYIPAGKTLLLNVPEIDIRFWVIEGNIIWDDTMDIHMSAEAIIINGGGFYVGSESKPYTKKGEITLQGHWHSPKLPICGIKTIFQTFGFFEMHGAEIQYTWSELAGTAEIGSGEITVVDPVDWAVGDHLVIAPSDKAVKDCRSDRLDDCQVEERLITKVTPVAGGGASLELDVPLAYRHVSETITGPDGRVINIRAEVGKLNRNLVIRGTQPYHGRTKYEKDAPMGPPGAEAYGGHVMLTDIGIVRFVEFNYMGQAFAMGRYPLHFHMSGENPNSKCIGNSVWRTFNRAYTTHGIHKLLVKDNVAYNTLGHAFFLEDGMEHHNEFLHNLGMLTLPSFSLLASDQSPATFWTTNPHNIWHFNHAAGSHTFGFWFDLNGGVGHGAQPTNFVQLLKFEDNVMHSNGDTGLWIGGLSNIEAGFDPRFECKPEEFNFEWVTGCGARRREYQEMVRTLTWGNGNMGSAFMESGHVAAVNFTSVSEPLGIGMLGSVADEWSGAENGYSKGPIVKFAVVKAKSSLPFTSACGVGTPWDDYLFVKDSWFVDEFSSGGICSCAGCAAPEGGFEVRVQNLHWSDGAANRKVFFPYSSSSIFWDYDGSITDKSECWLHGCYLHSLVENPNAEFGGFGHFPQDRCTLITHSNTAGQGDGALWCQPNTQLRNYRIISIADWALLKNVGIHTEYGYSMRPQVIWDHFSRMFTWSFTMIEGAKHKVVVEGVSLKAIADIEAWSAEACGLMKGDSYIIQIETLTNPDRYVVNGLATPEIASSDIEPLLDGVTCEDLNGTYLSLAQETNTSTEGTFWSDNPWHNEWFCTQSKMHTLLTARLEEDPNMLNGAWMYLLANETQEVTAWTPGILSFSVSANNGGQSGGLATNLATKKLEGTTETLPACGGSAGTCGNTFPAVPSNFVRHEVPAPMYSEEVSIDNIVEEMKVIRGKDWKWGDEDGGVEMSGTLSVYVDKYYVGIVKAFDKDTLTATVTWTTQHTQLEESLVQDDETHYRIGAVEGGAAKYDLAVYEYPAETLEQFLHYNCEISMLNVVEVTRKWSNCSAWPGEVCPQDEDNITIPYGTTVLLDTDTAKLNEFHVKGTLKFLDDADITLTARYMIIHAFGGKVEVGSQDAPFMHKATIRLMGHRMTPQLKASGAGSKFILVRGELLMFGSRPAYYTRLVDSAEANDDQLVLSPEASQHFKVGDKIVITSTERDYRTMENRTILAITSSTNDGNTVLSLDEALSYAHKGEDFIPQSASEFEGELAAWVGLAEPEGNIVIEGENTEGPPLCGVKCPFNNGLDGSGETLAKASMHMKDPAWLAAHGCRPCLANTDMHFGVSVHVQPFSPMKTECPKSVGTVRLDAVSFRHCGQRSYLERQCLLFYGVGSKAVPEDRLIAWNKQKFWHEVPELLALRSLAAPSSTVNGCTISAGYMGGVGVSVDYQPVQITNNVIYDVKQHGLGINAGNAVATGNLVAQVRDYLENEENYRHWPLEGMFLSAIFQPMIHVFGIVAYNFPELKHNIVVGVEYGGFLIQAEACETSNKRIADNIVASSHIGILTQASYQCTELSGWKVLQSSVAGTRGDGAQMVRMSTFKGKGFTSATTMRYSDFLFIDNRAAFTHHATGTNGRTHGQQEWLVELSSSIFVGGKDSQAITTPTWSGIMGGNDGELGCPISNKNGPTLYGSTIMDNCRFVGYRADEGGVVLSNAEAYLLATNPRAQHYQVRMTNIVLEDVDEAAKVKFANSAGFGGMATQSVGCSQFNCDGLRSSFLVDDDGSFLGSKGTVIARHEQEFYDKLKYVDPLGFESMEDLIPFPQRYDKSGLAVPFPEGVMGIQEDVGQHAKRYGRVAIGEFGGVNTTQSEVLKGPVYKEPGFYRKGCTFKDEWNAWSCEGGQHRQFIVEIMDYNYLVRRWAPVTVEVNDEYKPQGGYLSMFTGPKRYEMGAVERLSTFWGLGHTGHRHNVYLSGSPPNHLRLHWRANADDEGIVACVYYGLPNNIDVYVDGQLVAPLFTATWDNYKFQELDPATQPHGTNIWDRVGVETGRPGYLYVVLKGKKHVDLKVSHKVKLTTKVELDSNIDFTTGEKDEYWNTGINGLTQSIVLQFGIPPNKVVILGNGTAQPGTFWNEKTTSQDFAEIMWNMNATLDTLSTDELRDAIGVDPALLQVRHKRHARLLRGRLANWQRALDRIKHSAEVGTRRTGKALPEELAADMADLEKEIEYCKTASTMYDLKDCLQGDKSGFKLIQAKIDGALEAFFADKATIEHIEDWQDKNTEGFKGMDTIDAQEPGALGQQQLTGVLGAQQEQGNALDMTKIEISIDNSPEEYLFGTPEDELVNGHAQEEQAIATATAIQGTCGLGVSCAPTACPEGGCTAFSIESMSVDGGVDAAPMGWNCAADMYAAGDGCDCDCGAWDPDCDDNSPSGTLMGIRSASGSGVIELLDTTSVYQLFKEADTSFDFKLDTLEVYKAKVGFGPNNKLGVLADRILEAEEEGRFMGKIKHALSKKCSLPSEEDILSIQEFETFQANEATYSTTCIKDPGLKAGHIAKGLCALKPSLIPGSQCHAKGKNVCDGAEECHAMESNSWQYTCGTDMSAWTDPSQGFVFQMWKDVSVNNVAALETFLLAPPEPDVTTLYKPPSAGGTKLTFDVECCLGDKYIAQLKGRFMADMAGEYIFKVRGDDYVQLKMKLPDGKLHKIAYTHHWTHSYDQMDSQVSSPIYLEPGLYDIEVGYAEGSGGDYVRVAVTTPDGIWWDPIPIKHMIFFEDGVIEDQQVEDRIYAAYFGEVTGNFAKNDTDATVVIPAMAFGAGAKGSLSVGFECTWNPAAGDEEWTPGVLLSSSYTIELDKGKEVFNALFTICPVVRYKWNGEYISVYVRTSEVPQGFDAYWLFTDTWSDEDNKMGTDFELYDTIEDATAEQGAWTFCNFNHGGIGFPRDCGKNGNQGGRWFTMPDTWAKMNIGNGAGFEVYTGDNCPSEFGESLPAGVGPPTTVNFEMMVYAPNELSNSILVSVDGGEESVLFLNPGENWQRSDSTVSFAVSTGKHTLKFGGREDGLILKNLYMMNGEGCKWDPMPR